MLWQFLYNRDIILLRLQDDKTFDVDDNILGDIYISIDKVYSQAEEYGHSRIREFSFLAVHGMLHLLGYDHEDEDERIQMENRQKEILEYIGITRED